MSGKNLGEKEGEGEREREKVREREKARSESILKQVKPPDLLSLLNALLGFSAILLVLDGAAAVEVAVVLILAAAVVDGLDGAVARRVESSEFGEYLDSLADLLSFGVAPAVVVCVLLAGSSLALCVCSAYLVSGMLRLARFNANFLEKDLREDLVKGDFKGFPITMSAVFLASFLLVSLEFDFPFHLSSPLLLGLTAVLSLLMPSRIKYKKMKEKRILVPLVLIFFTLFLLFFSPLFALRSLFVYPAAALLVLTALYALSPLVLNASK